MKCWICGKEAVVKHMTYDNRTMTYAKHPERWRAYCNECYQTNKAEQEKLKAEYVRLKKAVMFENALSKLEGQKLNIYDYREAIDAVEEYVKKKPDSFDSSYEMIAAIILIHNRIHCKPQYKVDNYSVDFLLPEEFVVLEIDGERHKNRKGYDSVRDQKIKKALGPEWEIIRIDAELLDENAPNLVTAIRKIVEYRIFGNHKGIYSKK